MYSTRFVGKKHEALLGLIYVAVGDVFGRGVDETASI